MIINTHGKWRKFEKASDAQFELGKTYKIEVDGNCEFAVSIDEPVAGIQTNSINYTHSDNIYLWIRTK